MRHDLFTWMLFVTVSMPEIAINEYGYLLPCQSDVWDSWQFLIVLSVPKSGMIKRLAKPDFWPSILALIACHGPMALLGCHHVHLHSPMNIIYHVMS